MGILLKILRWVWKAFSQYTTLDSLAQMLDLKTVIAGTLGSVAMLIFGSLNYDWSPQTVVAVAAIVGGSVALIFLAVSRIVVSFRSKERAEIPVPPPTTSIETKSAALLENPNFGSELKARKYQIQTWIDGLLAEASSATNRRNSGDITESEFDDEIKALGARRSGGIRLYVDELLEEVAKIVPNGVKSLVALRTTARAGNYRHGGEFLSFNHASLVATLKVNKEQLTGLLDEALLQVEPPPTDQDTPPVALRLNYRAGRDQVFSASIVPSKELTNVIALGSYAVSVHYVTHAEWKWSSTQRLAARDNLIAGETVDVPFVERMHFSSNPQDRTILAGSELVLPNGTDMIEGCLVLVKIKVSTSEGEFGLKKLLNLRLVDGRQFIDTLDLDAHGYIEDRGARF